MSPLRVCFFGSGQFAVPTLERLASLHAGSAPCELVGVVSRPDRPAGRGRAPRATPVKARACELGLEVETPETVNDAAVLAALAARGADVFVVADYGEFLRKRFRSTARIGAYNLHGSLLPRHRGAAPVAYAIRSGDTATGVTLFRIERELDAGPIVDAASIPIADDDTAGSLEAKLAPLAADLLERNLEAFRAGTFREVPQDASLATLAPKLAKAEGAIDWSRPACEVAWHVRAMRPWPVAFSVAHRAAAACPERVRVLAARAGADSPSTGAAPGEVVCVSAERLAVACGEGCLELLELQREGKAALAADALLRGWPLAAGDRFETS